ncbi:MAG: pitrilysin family protein, partial [Bacillota bacterium]
METNRCELLDNGLRVSIAEDHRSPAIAFFTWYPVGGSSASAGPPGASHWVEHMMFRGTPRYPSGILDRRISSLGGRQNGFTDQDCTAFYQVLPRGYLELAADIEADRMRNCPFDWEDVERERTVILSERDGAENEPDFLLSEAVLSAAFTVHPYRRGVLGSREDILGVSRDDLLQHYRRNYGPTGSHITVAGAVSADEALSVIAEKFGRLPPNPEKRDRPPSPEPTQSGERRVELVRPGGPRRYLAAYHTPSASHGDAVPLHVVEAILSGGTWPFGFVQHGMGRSSRLYVNLMDTGIATEASASFAYARDPHLFEIFALPCEGVAEGEIEGAIEDILLDLASAGPRAEELARAKAQLRAQYTYNDDAASRALAMGGGTIAGIPDMHLSFPPRVARVSEEDVARVTRDYLVGRNRTRGWFIPGEQRRHPSPTRAPIRASADSPPSRGKTADTLPGSDTTERRELESGTRALFHRRRDWGGFRLDLLLPAGSIRAPKNPGLATIAAALLCAGTRDRDYLEIANLLDSGGIVMDADCDFEYTAVSLECRGEDRTKSLALLREVLCEPTYPTKRVQNAVTLLRSRLLEAREEAAFVASQKMRRTIYPEGHPYRESTSGNREALSRIDAAAVSRFRRDFWVPSGAILAATGDLEPDRALDEILEILDPWLGGKSPGMSAITIPPVPPSANGSHFRMELPGTVQMELRHGGLAPARNHPDYRPFRLGMMILGGPGVGGRLGEDIREDKGMAYYVGAGISSDANTGLWSVRAGIDPSDAEEVLESIRRHTTRLAENPPGEEEMNRMRGYVHGNPLLRLEKAGGLTASLVGMERHGLGIDYLRRLPSLL